MLILPPQHRRELERFCRADYPREACGLLLGTGGGETHRVRAVVHARNLQTERPADRYELDPDGFLAADLRARSAGWEIIGIWHSHPDHPAVPSETDREAAWEGWSYLIAAIRPGEADEMRSWRLQDQVFREEELGSVEPASTRERGPGVP